MVLDKAGEVKDGRPSSELKLRMLMFNIGFFGLLFKAGVELPTKGDNFFTVDKSKFRLSVLNSWSGELAKS